jgi:SAM-dependent methyltransferase
MPARVDGFLAWAPELAKNNDGFPQESFEGLARVEAGNFWFRARNDIILWALRKYFPGFHSLLEVGCGTGFVLSGIVQAYPNARMAGSEIYPTGLAFAAKRGFGVLSVNGTEGPLAAHVPFVFDKDGMVEMHLVRSNPIARMEGPVPALLAVQGPDAYISPDWYGAADQVPTWNYVAVHLRGVLHPLPVEALEPHLDALSAEFEDDDGDLLVTVEPCPLCLRDAFDRGRSAAGRNQ